MIHANVIPVILDIYYENNIRWGRNNQPLRGELQHIVHLRLVSRLCNTHVAQRRQLRFEASRDSHGYIRVRLCLVYLRTRVENITLYSSMLRLLSSPSRAVGYGLALPVEIFQLDPRGLTPMESTKLSAFLESSLHMNELHLVLPSQIVKGRRHKSLPEVMSDLQLVQEDALEWVCLHATFHEGLILRRFTILSLRAVTLLAKLTAKPAKKNGVVELEKALVNVPVFDEIISAVYPVDFDWRRERRMRKWGQEEKTVREISIVFSSSLVSLHRASKVISHLEASKTPLQIHLGRSPMISGLISDLDEGKPWFSQYFLAHLFN